MNAEVVANRFSSALRYLEFLESIRSTRNWLAEHGRFMAQELTTEEALALVHPRFLIDVGDADFIRGRRSFDEEVSAEWCQCQSEMVWGYVCPIRADSFQADHFFPYGAGGATETENRIWLCPSHNSVKSSDVHLYRWEAPLPNWVTPRLALMVSRLR